jgi:hypothetical protein
LSAIAQAFGGKKTNAMAAFKRGLGGSSASAADSGAMSGLRGRIQGFLAREERRAS